MIGTEIRKIKSWLIENLIPWQFLLLVLFGAYQNQLSATTSQGLRIGTASIDITPPLPAAVDGQMRLRVATIAETALLANVVVLELKDDFGKLDVSVLISCDLVTIPYELRDKIRESVAFSIPELDTRKIIINATHTHTGGVIRDGWYAIPDTVTQAVDYQNLVSRQVTRAVAVAWKKRDFGSISWGMGHAKVAYIRRAVYKDGSAKMYGKTNQDDFRKMEGYEDQSIFSLFFWDQAGKLIATCINVSSPAQIVESRSTIHADYWDPVRQGLQKKFGSDLVVLGWIGAAGDQTPRPMYDQFAELRMVELRQNNSSPEFESGSESVNFRSDSYLDEVGDRIVNAVMQTYDTVSKDQYREVVFDHAVEEIDLPMRLVTEEEYHNSKKLRDEDLNDNYRAIEFSRRIAFYDEVVKRFENQQKIQQPMYPVEIHALRIGDVVICTNPFEMFTDFGIQIKARSRALQTFIIQLVGPGTYLATKEALAGGHYSAIVESNRVGPEGGQILVDHTISMISALWPK
ncbi:hypothetical protein [Lunatibacter salilacus]|uniref:hypothetical protein n=1 Tax=Lunatibacter salilacus TaxID=2483804 RepID=UPI00131D8434|nr:hypothetical protein [Lunatibacter salilacus]